MKNKIVYFLFLTLLLTSCDSPDKSYENALNSRSPRDFQDLIDTYPESKFSDSARTKLIDINFWSKIDSSLSTIDYETYLDSFPDGLFQQEAEIMIKEISAFDSARNVDTKKAYLLFQDTYPKSAFNDSIMSRIVILEPAFKGYEILKDQNNVEALKSYLQEYSETGYGKILKSKLDSLTLKKLRGKLFALMSLGGGGMKYYLEAGDDDYDLSFSSDTEFAVDGNMFHLGHLYEVVGNIGPRSYLTKATGTIDVIRIIYVGEQ